MFANGQRAFSLFSGADRRRLKDYDVIHPLHISLTDLYNGKMVKLQHVKSVICTVCNGTGGKSGTVQSCVTCHGRGMKITMHQLGPSMYQQMQSMCTNCDGEGEVIAEENRCEKCGGKKMMEENKILEVNVKRGMQDTEKIVFRGEGDHKPGFAPGNVIIVLQTCEHDTFVRRGDDLFMEKCIPLSEALCGVSAFVVNHLDGRHIRLLRKAGDVIKPGSWRGIVGEGMPLLRAPQQKGTLFVKFDVEFPIAHFHNDHPHLYQDLEALLPPPAHRTATAPTSTDEHVDEVSLMVYDAQRNGSVPTTATDCDDVDSNDDNHNDVGDDENGGLRCAQA